MPVIRAAGPDDMDALVAAMRALAQHLGDPWRSSAEDLRAAAFGPRPSFAAVLAEGDGGAVGAAMFSPVYSTMRGAPGLFVSDLWAAPEARGRGLGRRLLAAATGRAENLWGARWLKLAVHHDNPRARDFYDRLGFAPDAGLDVLVLEGDALRALGDA